MDGDDFTLMTTESMAIVLDDNGCCVRHPSIKLKDYNKNGDVYLRESCPECQSAFMKSQSLLLEKRRELDRKLQELGDDSPRDDRHADLLQMVAPNVVGLEPGSHTPYLSPTLPMVRPVLHDLDALAAQVHHIQHMQDILTLQKDRELHELRDKLEALQLELTDKKIEIALLHEKMSQQQMSYERELKLIQRAVALDKERREVRETSQGTAKEIHISSLNVQVGKDYAESSVSRKVRSAGEESTEGPKNSNSPIESSMTSLVEMSVPTGMVTSSLVLAETLNDSSNMATITTAYPAEATSDSEERPSPVSRSVMKEPIDEEYEVVESTQEQWISEDPSFRSYDSSTEGVSTYLNSTPDEIPRPEYPFHRPLPEPNEDKNSEDGDDEEEEEDKFDASGHGPAPPVTSHHFKDEDNSVAETTGPTVASSTYGENRHVVSNRTLLDPYGDKGLYSGVLLLSTNLPHGNGKMLYEDDGRTYDGDWRHGRWHGWGKATFSNGDRFEGFYKYDQRHGQGKYEWSDGRVYEGEFSDDKRCGKGHFIWPDGADYVGDFENGQRHGHGVYQLAHNAGQYDGEWVNGRYEGYGDCKWSDGRMYKGEWKAGMAHGRGTEWYPDGRIRHEGQWFEDEPVRDG